MCLEPSIYMQVPVTRSWLKHIYNNTYSNMDIFRYYVMHYVDRDIASKRLTTSSNTTKYPDVTDQLET